MSDTILYRPAARFDLLRVPVLGSFLRWHRGRLVLQALLLLLAALVIYDGLTGPQLAPENLATVVVWLHYRGLVALALLLVGNLFCMSCPFTLPRTLARRLSGEGRRWPRLLRNKWLAIAVFVLFLFLYEWFDMWASPWLTAWIVVAYFLAAFVLESVFAESPFCKYVCPLSTFNYVGATISPLQISVREQEICRTCAGKECINGSAQVLGCGTLLFPPQITSNMDCLFCLDCARACPYENVSLVGRSPLQELSHTDSWPRRWDLGLLVLVFAFAGLANAFGMVPPFYGLLEWLAAAAPWAGEGLFLLLIFGTIELLLPVALGLGAAWLSRSLARRPEPLRVVFSRYAPALVPLAFAIWLAHYGFHFATGALSVIPVFQNFLLDHGIDILGKPDWSLGALIPLDWLLPLEIAVVIGGLAASLVLLGRRAAKEHPVAQLPWLLLLLALALAAIWLFTLPMEMRGTNFMA